MGSLPAQSRRPHVVCVPFPAQGHVSPMLKVAKILHHKGFYITFVNTEFNHKRLLKSRGPNALEGLPDFRFDTIPDGLPPCEADVTQDITELCKSSTYKCLAPFRQLIAKLNSSHDGPPVTGIVADGVMTFSLDVAQELGIPGILFWTTSACGGLGYATYRILVERGLTPLKDESQLTNGYLEEPIYPLPGYKGIRLKDFPSFVTTRDRNDFMLNFEMEQINGAFKASAIFLNTFEELEHDVLAAIRARFPPVYTIGPLHMVIKHLPQDDPTSTIESNLWIEEPECITWLDSKPPNSVIYVNFGSITTLTAEQLAEFAWGLANSNITFLWPIRPDLTGGDSSIFPPGFAEETKDRCLMPRWCPQEQFLKHPSVGGFLSHMGWNSTLESLSSGVPMIGWPFFAEQPTNCRFACIEWGIGMEINNNVKRDEVEKLVKELMCGEKGKALKKKALEWKEKAAEVAGPRGESVMNFDKMVKEILLQPKPKIIS